MEGTHAKDRPKTNFFLKIISSRCWFEGMEYRSVLGTVIHFECRYDQTWTGARQRLMAGSDLLCLSFCSIFRCLSDYYHLFYFSALMEISELYFLFLIIISQIYEEFLISQCQIKPNETKLLAVLADQGPKFQASKRWWKEWDDDEIPKGYGNQHLWFSLEKRKKNILEWKVLSLGQGQDLCGLTLSLICTACTDIWDLNLRNEINSFSSTVEGKVISASLQFFLKKGSIYHLPIIYIFLFIIL